MLCPHNHDYITLFFYALLPKHGNLQNLTILFNLAMSIYAFDEHIISNYTDYFCVGKHNS